MNVLFLARDSAIKFSYGYTIGIETLSHYNGIHIRIRHSL